MLEEEEKRTYEKENSWLKKKPETNHDKCGENY